jgi:ATP-dependent exoDNAse (exonuclease V) alpha subunit
MSLYHFSVKQVSRSKGQTVVNSAAYISGQKLRNEYYGETHDYTRKHGVIFTEIMAPDYVPGRLLDRETLWNEVENVEKNKRAQLAYSFDIALQNELTLEENIQLAREFCREQFVARGMIVDFAVHEGDSDDPEVPDNPHFHVLAPIRPVLEDGTWGNKQKREYRLDEDGNRVRDEDGNYIFNAVSTTGWNAPELLTEWRKAWADKVNEKFRANNLAARIDHRSYEEQGIQLIPTIHEGYEVQAMEKKGIRTEVGNLNRMIRKLNEMWISLKESIRWIQTLQEEISEELYHRYNPTLVESLQEYYDRRNEVADTYAYGSNKAHLTNLQEFSSVIVYLEQHQITSVEELHGRVEELESVVADCRKEIAGHREQIAELAKRLDEAKRMEQHQPLMDKYNSIWFKGKKASFYKEHKKQIDQYQMCRRKLEPYRDKEGNLPLAKWERERQELLQMNKEAADDKAPFEEELKMVKKVEMCIDIMRSGQDEPKQAGDGRSEEKEQSAAQAEASTKTKEESQRRPSIRARLQDKKKEVDRREAGRMPAKDSHNRNGMSL